MELSIGELSRLTGVPVATLRSWEARFGEPQALPRSGGHRRYAEHAVTVVREIQGRRSAGLTLPAAMAAVNATEDEQRSVFAGLRERHPEVTPYRLSKPTVLSLTHAIEDEYVARSTRAVLFACFQRGRFFAQSEKRWQELSRVADLAVVLADFAGHDLPSSRPDEQLVHVPLDPGSPLLREWLVVCDSDDYPICMAARELLTSGGTDARRQFETVWSLDPEVVRTASRLCAAEVAHHRPEVSGRLASPGHRLRETPQPASPDLQRATNLFGRLVSYLEAGR